MASTKPEGLSPCFGSLISPDILSSYKFKWQPPSTQSSYTITVYSSNQTSVLKTYNGTGSTSELSASTLGYSFVNGTTYYWDVSVNGGAKSTKAKFIYKTKPQRPSILWTTTEPLLGDKVLRSGRLTEIKNNILTLLDKYGSVDSTIQSKASNLFTGEIIPLRKDFNDLQTVLQYIGEQEGVTYKQVTDGYVDVRTDYGPTKKWNTTDNTFSAYNNPDTINSSAPNLNVITWVEDSLGVSDLDNIVDYINWLANRPPAPIEEFSITMGSTLMYPINTIAASHSNNLDTTIDVSWTLGAMPSTNGTITFTSMSSSNDIWFYESRFSYGPNGIYQSVLFFDEQTLPASSDITFDAGWATLYTSDTIDNAVQQFDIYVIDHSANISELRTVKKTYNSNFRVPVGFDHYELQYQKAKLGTTVASSTGTWVKIATINNASTLRYTYTASGAEGVYFYRIKAVDKSGLESGWKQSSPVTFDPLDPPTAPSALKVASVTTDRIVWSWNHGLRVSKYEVKVELTSNGADITSYSIGDNEPMSNTTSRSGLNADTSYTFSIRSVNSVGASAWVKVTGRTKADIAEKTWNSTGSGTWRNNWGWRTTATEKTRVYQGEWCEIAGSAHPSGPVGTCWGKNKGIWLFDYSDIKSTLAGKDILDIKIYVNRMDTYHGYYSDQVLHMWLHNHGSKPGGEPSLFTHYEVRNPTFAKGESAWIDLPNSYGNALRDGNAKGLGLYVPNWGRSPYVYCSGTAQLKIKYQG